MDDFFYSWVVRWRRCLRLTMYNQVTTPSSWHTYLEKPRPTFGVHTHTPHSPGRVHEPHTTNAGQWRRGTERSRDAGTTVVDQGTHAGGTLVVALETDEGHTSDLTTTRHGAPTDTVGDDATSTGPETTFGKDDVTPEIEGLSTLLTGAYSPDGPTGVSTTSTTRVPGSKRAVSHPFG